jgi:tRNA threonylcarbamoyladenosine biosynthesis protein TsaE
MSTGVTSRIKSISSEQTEQLGAQIGARLKGGEVIELVSDLGGGKTTFVRGLARGAGSTDKVASPTFTLCKVYRAGNSEIHHFDFYRLHEAGIMADELAEVIGDPHVVVVVEWADAVQHVLPGSRLTVHIAHEADDARVLAIHTPADLAYLTEGIE